MKDQISIQRIQQLHPLYRETFSNFITECEQSHNNILRIMLPVFRSIQEQNSLYAQGRTTKGKIVTNAKGGTSFHNYGLAIDLCEMSQDDKEVLWNYDMSLLVPIANKYKMEWGGSWVHIKDRPHFELRLGYSEDCRELYQMVKEGKIDAQGYIIFSNSVTN